MSKTILITILAAVATAAADPLVLSAPLVASPYTSAAYVNPSAAYVSPSGAYVGPSAAYVTPDAPIVAPVGAGVPAAVPAVPAAYPAAVPFSSVSAYSYGSTYSIQDYFPAVVNPSPSLAYTGAAYSLPYAYAADYFYRR